MKLLLYTLKISGHFQSGRRLIERSILLLILLGAPILFSLGSEPNKIVLANSSYKISVPADFASNPFVVVERSGLKPISRRLAVELCLIITPNDPAYTNADASEVRMPVAAWKLSDNKTTNPFTAGTTSFIKASGIESHDGSRVTFNFPTHAQYTLSLSVSLPEGAEPPIIEWTLVPKTTGYFSLAFSGITGQKPDQLDFLYQPMVWSWKRFPQQPYLSTEQFATTAATFVNSKGVTEGVTPDPSEIPYRFATHQNSKFGFLLRDAKGLARPMVFAPILGGEGSKLTPGQNFKFKSRYVLQAGDWYAGLNHILYDVFKYKAERENATVSLSQTLENMIDLGMGPYGGWVSELKGFDYKQDALGTVKVVSALHALGVALSTGNMEVYKKRALPMMEYVMSREKYLYSVSDTIRIQNPSHYLKGPCVEIGELAGLYDMTGGKTTAFKAEAERVFGKPRKLNLETATGGGAWYDYLYKYSLSENPSDLQKAKEDADFYLKSEVSNYPSSFTTNAGLKDRQSTFYTDFTPRIFDLFELYQRTGEKKYLDASVLGARQMLLWLRSNPMAPDSIITVNAGGKAKGWVHKRYKINSYESLPNFNDTTEVAEQKVEAWRTSLVGLPPEQPYTYLGGGPIMLTHHAAWLLRLAEISKDSLLEQAATNAIIGRYANFPGYYFTTLGTTVYQHPEYPLKDYWDIRFNFMFYNHIWPHIALLIDYLVSEASLKSAGEVDFPSAYAPGYAYLTSKVYGHKPGKIFGTDKVRLWIPSKAAKISTVSLNHFFGVGAQELFMVLSNTSKQKVTSEVQLQADIVPWNKGQEYNLTFYYPGGKTTTGKMKDGRFTVEVAGLGLTAVKIEKLKINIPLHSKGSGASEATSSQGYFRKETGNTTLGTLTGMLFNFSPDFSDAFIYTDATEKTASKVKFKYKIGNSEWQQVEDSQYPYEHSIHLENPKAIVKYQIEATDHQGKTYLSDELELKN